ncbi:AarF/UbiB family protein [Thermincola ferriacetica]
MVISRTIKLLALLKGLVKKDYGSVSAIMGEMHGLPQKLGQHFTLYRGSGLDRYFASLCTESKTEKIPVAEALNRLGLNYAEIAVYAQASIGQVYRVKNDAGDLALKVKYPAVEKRIKSDLWLLKGIIWPTRFLPLQNSGLLPMLENLRTMLLNECDYMAEAEKQQRFCRVFRDHEAVSVPEIIAYNDEAIASRWVEGNDLRHYPGTDKWFVENYTAFILYSLKALGMVHADPHPGNFIINGSAADRKLTVLDFGSVVEFTPVESAAVSRLLTGGYASEAELIKDLQLLGVSEESLATYRPIIGDLVSVLLEPFYCPGAYDFGNWRMQHKINTLLASRAWEKPLQIPLKLLLLFRALQGLYYYAGKSAIKFNWHEAAKTYLG